MANDVTEKAFSDLDTAGQLDNTDIFALSKVSGSGWISAKTSLTALATKIATAFNFTSDLQTTSKTLTGAINEIAQGGGGGSTDVIADDFSTASTYAVGDYVIYNDSLYKCTTAVTTAGAWDSTKWTETLVMDEVEAGGGGGTTVVANPSGEATDDLTKVQIGSTIYDIPSGGSSGGVGKILKGVLTAGQTSITFNHGSITTSSLIDYYTSIFGVNPTNASGSTGSVTLTFAAQSSDMDVAIIVFNEDVIEYNLIPRMTSNTDNIGTASASYVYSYRYAYYGFTTDGNGSLGSATSFWYNNAANNYLQYVFNVPKHISKIGFGSLEATSVNLTFKFQFTTDGTNWTDGDTNTITSNDWTWYELSDTVDCLGFRIYCIGNISTVSGVQAYGWE